MTSKRRNRRSKGPLVVGLVLAAGVLGGLAYYVSQGPPSFEEPPVSAQEQEQIEGETIEVRVPVARGDRDITFEMTTKAAPKGVDPVVFAVNEFLKETRVTPLDARLESVRMEGTTAVLEFTPSFRRTYGTDAESVLIRGIIWAVSQNSGARAVVFTEGGTAIETLGNADLSGPQPVDPWLRLG